MYWSKFTLVNRGYERLRVKRRGQIIFDGTVPTGFAMDLTVGDVVFIHIPHRMYHSWIRKFAIVIWHGKPHIRLGKAYSKKNLHISLEALPHVPGLTFWGHMRKKYARAHGTR